MAKVAIRMEGVGKVYRKKKENYEAVRDVSFQVLDKQFVSIIGPSGSGKSTVLKMLGGIEEPTAGTISFYDHAFKAGVPKEALKQVGFVFQNHNLLRWRSVRKNLELPLEVLGLKVSDHEARMAELLKMVNLSSFEHAYPHELSGGMRQRVGVIRSLVHDPDIVLMDQPFGALDAITRKQLNVDLLHLWKETQKTIVMITNDVEEALFLSSRILVMSKAPGRIIQDIPVDIPVEQRNASIKNNGQYLELRDSIKAMIKEEQTEAS